MQKNMEENEMQKGDYSDFIVFGTNQETLALSS